MRFATITRWEFKNTIKSRKFLLIFFMQISILFLMIMVFNSFSANLESGESISLTPSLFDFASLDVEDQGGLIVKRLNPETLILQNSTLNNSLNRIEQGRTNGFYIVPNNSIELIKDNASLNTLLYLDYKDPKRSVVRDEVNTTSKIFSTALTTSYLQSYRKTNISNVTQENTGESLPLKIVRKFMLVILLFLPLFLFGNLIVDSIVGEKERKTGEILLAMPITPADVIIGKSMSVVLTMALQVAMWMIILLGAGFQINNALLVYLTIILASIPIVAFTTIIAAYTKNYKEAGIGITLSYTIIVGFLIVPMLAYLSRQSPSANISPMTLALRLFSGEQIPLSEAVIPIVFCLILTIVGFCISISLFKRDDVVFGPRPGLLRLILELFGIKKRGGKQ